MIHQTARPDKLGGEEGQAEEDDQPAGTGGEKHDNPNQKKGEPGENSKEAPNLVNRPEEHEPSWAEGQW
jgi:hypothetical protein